jgi:hypothetical protein
VRRCDGDTRLQAQSRQHRVQTAAMRYASMALLRMRMATSHVMPRAEGNGRRRVLCLMYLRYHARACEICDRNASGRFTALDVCLSFCCGAGLGWSCKTAISRQPRKPCALSVSGKSGGHYHWRSALRRSADRTITTKEEGETALGQIGHVPTYQCYRTSPSGTNKAAMEGAPVAREGSARIPSTTNGLSGREAEAEAAGGGRAGQNSRGAAAARGCNRLVGHVSCPGAGAGPTSSWRRIGHGRILQAVERERGLHGLATWAGKEEREWIVL